MQGFTDHQRRAMLEAIHEREGAWGNIAAESEIIRVGQSLGLNDNKSLELFEQLVDEHYVDPGRVVQAPPLSSGHVQTVGANRINVLVTRNMRLTDRGRADIGVFRLFQGSGMTIEANRGASATEVAQSLRQVADSVDKEGNKYFDRL